MKATEVTYEFVADIRMSPATFKTVMLWMNQLVDIYEKAYGEILVQPIAPTVKASDTKLPQYG